MSYRAAPSEPPERKDAEDRAALVAGVGRMLSLADNTATGWAWLPRRPGYRVVVHALDGLRLLRSAMASRPSDPALLLDRTAYRFKINISDIPLERQQAISLVIGESETILPSDAPAAAQRQSRAAITVEDLLTIKSRNSWICGGTYLDAIDAGLTDEEIVELLYRDILGRSADNSGLESYIAGLRDGIITFDHVRENMLASSEYGNRTLRYGRLPGAIFSDRLVYIPYIIFDSAKTVRSLRTVDATKFIPLWGEEFVRVAYEEICRVPLADELRAAFQATLDGACASKCDILRRMADLANTLVPVVELVGTEQLRSAPARHYHELSLSALLRADNPADFVDRAHSAILGIAPRATYQAGLVQQLSDGSLSRGALLRAFVTEANNRGIPAIVALDQPDAMDVLAPPTHNEIAIVLDEHIVGYGWHNAERVGTVAFRWMPRAAGLLVPNVTGSDLCLVIDGSMYRGLEAIVAFSCTVNGVPIVGKINVTDDGRWNFTATALDRSIFERCYPTIIALQVSDPDVPQSPFDSRFLTLSVTTVTIRSTSG
jgi:Domain of unknown function (DUF4214)